MWEMSDALELIHRIQGVIKPLGFHVVLAGGVLNHGMSLKDLDLVFIPLWNDKAPDEMTLVCWLSAHGFEIDIDSRHCASHEPNPYSPYRFQCTATYGVEGRRVDIFII